MERLIGTIRREYLDHTLFWTTADSKTSCSISGPTSTTIVRIPHWKDERPIRPYHNQSQISARFDGNHTVEPYIRHPRLADWSKTRTGCGNWSTSAKLPKKSFGVSQAQRVSPMRSFHCQRINSPETREPRHQR